MSDSLNIPFRPIGDTKELAGSALLFIVERSTGMLISTKGLSASALIARRLATFLPNRVLAVREARALPSQCSFYRGTSCFDEIFTLQRILELRYEFQQPTAAWLAVSHAAFNLDHTKKWWYARGTRRVTRIVQLDNTCARPRL